MLTWQVAAHGPLRTLDERLGRALASGGNSAGSAGFFVDLGTAAVALPVLSVVVVWAVWRSRHGASGRAICDGASPRRWLPPLAAGLTAAAVPVLLVPLKAWLARPGPARMAGRTHEGFYPSGHGATAAVLYGLAVLLVIRRQRPTAAHPAARALTPTLITTVALLNAAIGLDLVRQGYHWPLDVLGSWCLSGVLLALWCEVCDRWSGGHRSAHPPGPANLP
ncbi:phosphatase PAP2 family protein [Streptomyces sioyaensis]|uniref:phosphatase PAP2 family protein n=1 Tax=Streptomyces sioyaensis TaxID=67364 RepID=UPI0033F8B5C5